jgi:hypothetical protein
MLGVPATLCRVAAVSSFSFAVWHDRTPTRAKREFRAAMNTFDPIRFFSSAKIVTFPIASSLLFVR